MLKGITKTKISISFLMVMLLIIMSACSSQKPAGGTQGTDPSVKEQEVGEAPVVKMLLGVATNFKDNNPVIEKIREATGVNLQVDTVVDSDYENRLNTLLVSGEAPDLIVTTKRKLKEYIENDVILPLNDLLDAHGANILENKGDYLKGPAYVDGNYYGIPHTFASGNALAIRKDWLDTLELEVPTTLEEYQNVLRAFVEQDPNQDGQKDTIGLGLSINVPQTWEHIFSAFGVPQGRQLLIDGEIIPWMLTPGYIDAIKYLNKLYKQGLVDPEFSTVPTLQSFEKLWNGKVGAYNFNADGITQNWQSRYIEDPAPEFVYTVIRGENGVGGYLKPYLEDANNYAVISSKTKYPEAAMKVLDYMVSEEGNSLLWAGVEGTHHEWVNGEFHWIPPFDDAVKLRDDGGYMYSAFIDRADGLREKLFNDITREGRQLVMDNNVADTYIYELPKVALDMGSILDEMEKEFRVIAMMSDGDIDAQYESFKTRYLKEGGSKWIEQATEIYNREKEAMK